MVLFYLIVSGLMQITVCPLSYNPSAIELTCDVPQLCAEIKGEFARRREDIKNECATGLNINGYPMEIDKGGGRAAFGPRIYRAADESMVVEMNILGRPFIISGVDRIIARDINDLWKAFPHPRAAGSFEGKDCKDLQDYRYDVACILYVALCEAQCYNAVLDAIRERCVNAPECFDGCAIHKDVLTAYAYAHTAQDITAQDLVAQFCRKACDALNDLAHTARVHDRKPHDNDNVRDVYELQDYVVAMSACSLICKVASEAIEGSGSNRLGALWREAHAIARAIANHDTFDVEKLQFENEALFALHESKYGRFEFNDGTLDEDSDTDDVGASADSDSD